jgi:hypothetical protein
LNKFFVVKPALDKKSVDWLPNLPLAGRYELLAVTRHQPPPGRAVELRTTNS